MYFCFVLYVIFNCTISTVSYNTSYMHIRNLFSGANSSFENRIHNVHVVVVVVVLYPETRLT